MRAGLAILAAFSVYALACAPAAAACYGTNSKTKQRQAVHEIYRGTHPKRYFAQATHDPGTGRPQIIYYSRYIVSRDVNSQTKVDYHGQGSAFWSKTASRCLG